MRQRKTRSHVSLERLEPRQVFDAAGFPAITFTDDVESDASLIVEEGASEILEEDLGDLILYTLSGNEVSDLSAGESEVNVDTNEDGVLTPLDVLLIINALNTQSSASGEFSSEAVSAPQVSFDINGDGHLTPVDALIVINRLNQVLSDESSRALFADDPNSDGLLPTDEPFDLIENGVKEITLADVGEYGVVWIRIDQDGVLLVEGDGQQLDVAVATDGSLHLGDYALPVKVGTDATGSAVLTQIEQVVEEKLPVVENSKVLVKEVVPTGGWTLSITSASLDVESGNVVVEAVLVAPPHDAFVTLATETLLAEFDVDPGWNGLSFVTNITVEGLPDDELWNEELGNGIDEILNEEGDIDPNIGGELSTRLAAFSILTFAAFEGKPQLILKIDSAGNITGDANGVSLEITVSEEGTLSVGDEVLPAFVTTFGDGSLFLVPTGERPWAGHVDPWIWGVDAYMQEFV